MIALGIYELLKWMNETKAPEIPPLQLIKEMKKHETSKDSK